MIWPRMRWPWPRAAPFKTVRDPLIEPEIELEGRDAIHALFAGAWTETVTETILTGFEQERMVTAWRKAKTLEDLEKYRAEVAGVRLLLERILVVKGDNNGT